MPVSEVVKVSLMYTRAPGHYCWNPGLTRLFHTKVLERTVHCWRLRLEKKGMINKVDHSGGDERNREHPACTTDKSHVGRLPRDEGFWRGDEKTRLRGEQKRLEIMTTIVRKCTRGGDLVMDTCAGTLSTAKVGLIIPFHGRYIGCDIDIECIREATPPLFFVLSKQAPHPD